MWRVSFFWTAQKLYLIYILKNSFILGGVGVLNIETVFTLNRATIWVQMNTENFKNSKGVSHASYGNSLLVQQYIVTS